MTTEDKPVDRDAWRRLLDGETGGPPELTDARIRAKARQALTPRTGRWWLPASLAASMLLAVVLVQQQYERPRAPAVVSESDYATAPAEGSAAAEPDDRFRDEALQRRDSPVPNAPAAAELEQAAPRDGAETKEDLRNFTPAPPVAPPPQVEMPAVEESRVLSGVAADAAPGQRSSNVESSTPVTEGTSADLTSQGVTGAGALMKSRDAERTPEEWYAEIEKLRAAGKKHEAERELQKLEEVHPGWLEKNHPTDR